MQTLLLNASLKKTGTTYLHKFFELHQDKIPNLIVPPIKEWYFIPRVPPLATRAAVPFQHSLGQRAEEMYEKEANPQHKEFIRRVANRPSGFQMSVPEAVDRVSYILDAYEDDCIIGINDPNFLVDCVRISDIGKVNLLDELSKYFKLSLFTVHRNFASQKSSLAKMVFANENRLPPKESEATISILFALAAVVRQLKTQDFPVYDMEFAMSQTSAFAKDLFAMHRLGDLRDIEMPSPENPNIAAKIDYSPIANYLDDIEQHLKHFDNPAGIHQKKKVSSSEYANALVQMYQTWQR